MSTRATARVPVRPSTLDALRQIKQEREDVQTYDDLLCAWVDGPHRPRSISREREDED